MVSYQSGFHNYFASEAESGALPRDRNSPQVAPLGLYAEQVNNSAFTALRAQNFNSWFYRIRPSVRHCGMAQLVKDHRLRDYHHADAVLTPPDQMRWDPMPAPEQGCDFVSGLVTMAYNEVAAIHLYSVTQSMQDHYFYNADGDWLIVLQQGALRFKTEMGVIEAAVGEVVMLPRGIRFQVELLEQTARGYICENQASSYFLPERGPIGANGLAEERHFLSPNAYYEDKSGDFKLTVKFNGHLWQIPIHYSPLDVVAWHGNLAPYKYDLRLFTPINTVLKDHADPSIFTVLTAPSSTVGVANIDFVIFPPRWVTPEDTFRPPYYHRNLMSEYMGLIYGEYDAKKSGFLPGGSSVHNCMSAHGPDKAVFEQASNVALNPERYDNTLAFMFESRLVWQLSEFALKTSLRQQDYINCWQNLNAQFQPQQNKQAVTL